jgi:hypothetical protein
LCFLVLEKFGSLKVQFLCELRRSFIGGQARNQARDDQEKEQEIERAKMQLLQAVLDTKRGAQATADQRATIEEAMVRLLCLS